MGKKRQQPADPDRAKKVEDHKQKLRDNPEQMPGWDRVCNSIPWQTEYADDPRCEAFEQVAEETGYLGAAEKEITDQEDSDRALGAPPGQEQDQGQAQELVQEEVQESASEGIDPAEVANAVGFLATEFGALNSGADLLVEAEASLSASAKYPRLHAATKTFNDSVAKRTSALKTLKVPAVMDALGIGADVAGLYLAINKVRGTSKANPKEYGEAIDAAWTAAGCLFKDLILVGASTTPIGLGLNVLNGLLYAVDDEWFDKLCSGNRVLGDRITAHFEKMAKENEGGDEVLSDENDKIFQTTMVHVGSDSMFQINVPQTNDEVVQALLERVDQHQHRFGDEEQQMIIETQEWVSQQVSADVKVDRLALRKARMFFKKIMAPEKFSQADSLLDLVKIKKSGD